MPYREGWISAMPIPRHNRTLPVCIRFNEAGVQGKALTADKVRRNARGHDTLAKLQKV